MNAPIAAATVASAGSIDPDERAPRAALAAACRIAPQAPGQLEFDALARLIDCNDPFYRS